MSGRNAVRIIGGHWRRRLLRFPDSLALRPTPDRVRETLFNWLGQSLDGLDCLDLFAGSGALGLEAASRGAARVTLVEQAPAVFAALQENLRALGQVPGCTTQAVRADALQFVDRCVVDRRRFDLVFVDPPFRQGWWPKVRDRLDELAASSCRVYVEAEIALSPPDGWTLLRQGKAGQVFHHLFVKDCLHAQESPGDLPGNLRSDDTGP